MGAARLLRGLARVVKPRNLTVIVNTGDDDEFYGLYVSPDLDTIVYTLAGLAPVARGWGLRGDSFNARRALDRLYGQGWFALGDGDLATHIFRSDMLRRGHSLSATTDAICKALGVRVRVLPATDERLRTRIQTAAGELAFQDYLVHRRGRPRVSRVRFSGARASRPAAGVIEAIASADVVVVAPSNPFVSIAPILAVPTVRATLRRARRRVIAVSPLIGGQAVKGPLAAMLRSLGYSSDSAGIARYYRGLVSTLVVAHGDSQHVGERGCPRMIESDILIGDAAAAERLARLVIAAAL